MTIIITIISDEKSLTTYPDLSHWIAATATKADGISLIGSQAKNMNHRLHVTTSEMRRRRRRRRRGKKKIEYLLLLLRLSFSIDGLH